MTVWSIMLQDAELLQNKYAYMPNSATPRLKTAAAVLQLQP